MAAYATKADLANLGVANEALGNISDAQIDAVCESRSRFADGYFLAGGYEVPDGGFLVFGTDLTWAVSQLSCYDLVSNLGYTTDKGNQDNLRKRHDDALAWLEMIRDREIALQVTEEDGSSANGPVITAVCQRGWSRSRRAV